MTPEEIRKECNDIAGRWRRSGFDTREDYLDRLEALASALRATGDHWMIRREVEVLRARLTLSLTRANS